MVSARHISEYLDDVEIRSPIRECLAGLEHESYVTEVIPVGGFETRNTFHTDGLIVASDLVGVTHPLNRDGLSSNLAVCHAAARTIGRAVATNDFRSRSLRAYATCISDDVISPINAARRTEKSLRARPSWLWATKADLFPTHQGVTPLTKSATLSGKGDTGFRQRLRAFGRMTGVRKHAPGEYDE